MAHAMGGMLQGERQGFPELGKDSHQCAADAALLDAPLAFLGLHAGVVVPDAMLPGLGAMRDEGASHAPLI